MAVYKRTYRRYEGRLTPEWSRFLVLTRYALEDMNRSRFLTLFFFGTLLWPLLCALGIYVNHSLSALKLLQVPANEQIFTVNARFFLTFLGVQSMFAFFLAALTGPGLISQDLSNNALPLYLARPFSRLEYVLGKAAVLLGLFSFMTWVPGLALFALQSYLEGAGWMWSNLRIAGGLFFGSWIWIILLTLMALSLSAWVKWKPAAGGLMFGVLFVGAGLGAAINAMLGTSFGNLINITHLIGSVWVAMFEQPMRRGAGAVFFRVARGEELPLELCWSALIAICVLCGYLLEKKIRAMEVVK
jgi:ABC-2 type transport system permease protein